MNSLANLYAVFKTLQPELRAWLTSDEAMAVIEAIAGEFVLSKAQERQIPTLILRLVTQDIAPESFKAALAERLTISPDIATQIAESMRTGIFAPVEQVLRFNGVDVSAIGLDTPLRPSDSGGQAPLRSPTPPAPAPMPIATPPTPMPPPTLQPTPTQPASTAPAPTPAPAQPFILHAEPKVSAPEPVKPSFSFTSPTRSDSPRKTSAPKVVIERVVHYGALTTPLNQPTAQQKRTS